MLLLTLVVELFLKSLPKIAKDVVAFVNETMPNKNINVNIDREVSSLMVDFFKLTNFKDFEAVTIFERMSDFGRELAVFKMNNGRCY